MQKKKGHPVLLFFLWMAVTGMIAAILFLSFQDGIESKQLGERAIRYLLQRIKPGREVTTEEMTGLSYLMRQFGRIMVFFGLGLLGTITVHLSFRRLGWMTKTTFVAVFLFALAYLTEKMKQYLPTRHYSYEEMLMSIFSVGIGFLTATFLVLVVMAIKGIGKRMRIAHQQ